MLTPPRETLVASDDARISYVIDDFTDPWTRPETVVLIHAAMGTLNRFYAWVPHLARDFRVVRVDVRGHGMSDVGPIEHITHERIARDVTELLDQLGCDQAHIVGASSGGMTAAQVAIRFPQRARSIGLITTTPGLKTEQVRSGRWVEKMGAMGVKEFLRDTIAERIDVDKVDPGLVEWMLEDAAGTRVEFMAQFAPMLARERFEARLGEIRCPALMIITDSDPRVPLAEYQAIRDSIPDCEMIVYEGLRHNVANSEPDRCAQDLKSFLLKHRGPT